MPVATKFGSMVTYLEKVLPIKLRGPLITWFSKITWQIKFNISPLSQFL